MTTMLMMAGTALLALQDKQFVPFTPGQQGESISAPPLILAAYGFVWAAVVVYVWLLWRRLGRVERELADVNAKLAKRAAR